jgi:hypothetical protein
VVHPQALGKTLLSRRRLRFGLVLSSVGLLGPLEVLPGRVCGLVSMTTLSLAGVWRGRRAARWAPLLMLSALACSGVGGEQPAGSGAAVHPQGEPPLQAGSPQCPRLLLPGTTRHEGEIVLAPLSPRRSRCLGGARPAVHLPCPRGSSSAPPP